LCSEDLDVAPVVAHIVAVAWGRENKHKLVADTLDASDVLDEEIALRQEKPIEACCTSGDKLHDSWLQQSPFRSDRRFQLMSSSQIRCDFQMLDSYNTGLQEVLDLLGQEYRSRMARDVVGVESDLGPVVMCKEQRLDVDVLANDEAIRNGEPRRLADVECAVAA
jgi:hypothetical protein